MLVTGLNDPQATNTTRFLQLIVERCFNYITDSTYSSSEKEPVSDLSQQCPYLALSQNRSRLIQTARSPVLT